MSFSKVYASNSDGYPVSLVCSQKHRTAEGLRMKWTSEGHVAQPAAQAGPPSAGCQQTHWAVLFASNTWLSFSISLEKKAFVSEFKLGGKN